MLLIFNPGLIGNNVDIWIVHDNDLKTTRARSQEQESVDAEIFGRIHLTIFTKL